MVEPQCADVLTDSHSIHRADSSILRDVFARLPLSMFVMDRFESGRYEAIDVCGQPLAGYAVDMQRHGRPAAVIAEPMDGV